MRSYKLIGALVAAWAATLAPSHAAECEAELPKVKEQLDEVSKRAAQAESMEGELRELQAKYKELVDKATGSNDNGIEELRSALKTAYKNIEELKEGESSKVEAVKQQWKEEVAKLERQLKNVKLSPAANQSLLEIFLERTQIHFAKFKVAGTKVYKSDIAPKVDEAMAVASTALAPHFAALHDLFMEHFETVRPQYEKEVKPKLDMLSKMTSEYYKEATHKSKVIWNDFVVRFSSFRQQAIATLKSQPNVAPLAEEIIDATVFLVVSISLMLAVGPVLRLITGIIRNVLFYGLCCCCCCSRRRSVAANGAPVSKGKSAA
mmetsp:Transcript_3062/g.5180  ORF Transcript_3062/g.5180 Transcript_3062/m.5180 type:complete len:320 (-) Transcript_3062:83-1042(-)